MLGFLIKRGPLNGLAKAVPFARVLLAAEIAGMAWGHLTKLSRPQRRRALALLVKSQGRPSRLSQHERGELAALAAAFEPRLLAGSAVRRLSPLPVPRRVLYGRRGAPARKAIAQRP